MTINTNNKQGKQLYDYQQKDLEQIFERFENCPSDYNLLYQLPTGGGKTVIFSEITRRYIEQHKKKVLILTHRIELSRQTSSMLTEFGVTNKIIDSKVETLPDQDDYNCFVAMVETLNNRLRDEVFKVDNIGLVIIDEAHYNSFRKLLKYFEHSFILGVTATPLSSNTKLPMKDIYKELIVGHTISSLISEGFLAKANTYSYDVQLGSLKLGINGDYTVSSSEALYSNAEMLGKLLYAYQQRSLNKKTLIFNAGIKASIQVYDTFQRAGYPVRHLDSTLSKQQRKEIITWFRNTKNAILTSVGILTTGFDEPTIETIVLNRATRSLALYFQMIGRGSRVISGKSKFTVIDLGNNSARFGLWEAGVDWQKIFKYPEYYLDNIRSDEEIERSFKYAMPPEIRDQFNKSEDISFDMDGKMKEAHRAGRKTVEVLDESVDQHLKIIMENSDGLVDGLRLFRLLEPDITDRVRHYCYSISNSTRNYKEWLKEDYKQKLRKKLMMSF